MIRSTAALFLFFVLSTAASAGTITLPGHSETFVGANVRGYWFTAPVDFNITGLFVPTDASSGLQTIEVIRLNADPPVYTGTTDDFTSLFRTVSNATAGTIVVDIPVLSGQIIGILGYRGTTTTYAPAGPVNTAIDGQPVTLRRLGMQFNLVTTPAQRVWTEPSSNIGRVFFDFGPYNAGNVPEPSTWMLSVTGLGAALALRRRR